MNQRPGHKENWSGSVWRAPKCGSGGVVNIKWPAKVTDECIDRI